MMVAVCFSARNAFTFDLDSAARTILSHTPPREGRSKLEPKAAYTQDSRVKCKTGHEEARKVTKQGVFLCLFVAIPAFLEPDFRTALPPRKQQVKRVAYFQGSFCYGIEN
jgi:hypothetical protein